jgi:hypothetical protein
VTTDEALERAAIMIEIEAEDMAYAQFACSGQRGARFLARRMALEHAAGLVRSLQESLRPLPTLTERGERR